MSSTPLFVSCTDLHFTSKRPACRSDNYQKTMLKKFEQLLSEAKQTELHLILCAGDFFDSAKRNIGFSLLSDLIELINQYSDVSILTVPGNHDLVYHIQDIEDTPLRVLKESCSNFHVCDTRRFRIKGSSKSYDIFGAGWGWEHEELKKLYYDAKFLPSDKPIVNILLTHTTLFEWDLPAWADQHSYVARDFIDFLDNTLKINFQLIISGDNHESFVAQRGGTLLVNSGSMMRSKIDLMGYKPEYAVYYAVDSKPSGFAVQLKPFKLATDIFNMEYVNEHKEIKAAINLDFDKFLSEINSAVAITLDYQTALQQVIKKNYPELKNKLEMLLDSI